MVEAFKSLTGRWLGRFEYRRAAEPVGFEVDLVEDAGILSGDIREPNTFRPDLGAELFAVLHGSVSGSSVHFIKTYLEFSARFHPVYEGEVNAAMTRIEGIWRFPAHPGQSGRFVMMRKPIAASAAERDISAEMEWTR